MNLKRAILWVGVFLFAAIGTASAQYTSSWPNMSVAGDLNGWDANPNMQLVDDNQWQADLYVFSADASRFKFVANWGWEESEWGISNQVDSTVPIYDTAIFFDNPSSYGKDIVITNVLSGIYRFWFCDTNGEFTVELIEQIDANYSSMAVAGDLNGWNSAPNMTLVSNYTWQGEFFVGASSRSAFKFVAQNNWGIDYGDVNQVDFSVPINGTAELNPGWGNDIVMLNLASGLYRFTFNDSNRNYYIEYVRPGVANYSSMAVAGTWNSWNPIPNMTLITDHVWQATMTFENQGRSQFKFTANGQWYNSWGVSNQLLEDIPIMGTGDTINVSGYDFAINGPLNGKYHFRFNDETFYYEVFPEGDVQTFNEWAQRISYGNYTNDNWIVYDGLIRTLNTRYGLCIRLDQSPTSGQYLQTPYLVNGVLNFSFWYRNWNGGTPITYEVLTSTNGTEWVTNDIIAGITTESYAEYYNEMNETNAIYIRLRHAGGSERLLIDDFVIVEPFADVYVPDVYTVPEGPWTGDVVYIESVVVSNNFATNVSVTTYYKVGSDGAYTGIGTTGTTNHFRTVSAIPAQPPGTVVYYYIKTEFGGRGTRSPVYWPEDYEDNPAWYGIAHNRRGSVWINEVNYNPGFFETQNTNEYIEICGVAGADIGDWTLELLDAYVPYAMYTITNNTLLPNHDSGFGFFVVGDTGVPNVKISFTNVLYGDSSLAKNGTIQLKNEYGFVEYLLTYGENPPTNVIFGSRYIGHDNDFVFDDLSICVTGYGSNYYDLTWTPSNTPTPGEINYNQTLVGGYTDPLPDLSDADFMGALTRQQVTLMVESTNGWNAMPYYTTDIDDNWPDQWTPVSPFDSRYENGVNIITFDIPANTTTAYFRTQTERTW